MRLARVAGGVRRPPARDRAHPGPFFAGGRRRAPAAFFSHRRAPGRTVPSAADFSISRLGRLLDGVEGRQSPVEFVAIRPSRRPRGPPSAPPRCARCTRSRRRPTPPSRRRTRSTNHLWVVADNCAGGDLRCGTTTTAGRSPSRTRTTTACARSSTGKARGSPPWVPVRGVLRLRRHLLRARRVCRDGRGVREDLKRKVKAAGSASPRRRPLLYTKGQQMLEPEQYERLKDEMAGAGHRAHELRGAAARARTDVRRAGEASGTVF